MQYLLSIPLDDTCEIDSHTVTSIRRQLGDKVVMILHIDNRKLPVLLGEWVDCIDECLVLEDVSDTVIEQLELAGLEVNIVCLCDEEHDAPVANNTSWSL